MALVCQVHKNLRIFLLGLLLVQLAGCAGLSSTGSGSKGNSGGGTTAPAAPSGLQAMAGNAQVGLTWNASTGATGYNVKRATVSGGPYTQVAMPATNSYTDIGLANGTAYYYVVSAFNTAGQSANSPQASATPTAPAAPPAAPAGLQATAGNSQVSLTWTASAGATSYHVKRSTTSGGPYTQVAAPTTTSGTDTGLTNGTTYFYVVSALNTAGESANSSQ
ncbi:MAG: fibronectin type III domain-containing protein, partial [Candidatus Acidiferrales bacterium]